MKSLFEALRDSKYEQDWYTIHHYALAPITPQQGLKYFMNATLLYLIEKHPLSESYQKCVVSDMSLLAWGAGSNGRILAW